MKVITGIREVAESLCYKTDHKYEDYRNFEFLLHAFSGKFNYGVTN